MLGHPSLPGREVGQPGPDEGNVVDQVFPLQVASVLHETSSSVPYSQVIDGVGHAVPLNGGDCGQPVLEPPLDEPLPLPPLLPPLLLPLPLLPLLLPLPLLPLPLPLPPPPPSLPPGGYSLTPPHARRSAAIATA